VKNTVKVHLVMINLYIKTASTMSTNTIDKSENSNSENYSTIY